jgi:hypothetical protein
LSVPVLGVEIVFEHRPGVEDGGASIAPGLLVLSAIAAAFLQQ